MDTYFADTDFNSIFSTMSKEDLAEITAFFHDCSPCAVESQPEDANAILFGDFSGDIVDPLALSSEDRIVLEHVQKITGVQVVQPVLQQVEPQQFVDNQLSLDDFPVDAPYANLQPHNLFHGHIDAGSFDVFATEAPSPLETSDFFLNIPPSSQSTLFMDNAHMVTEAPPPMSMPDFTNEEVVACGTVQQTYQQQQYGSGPVVISQDTYQRLVSDNTGQRHVQLQALCSEQVVSAYEVQHEDVVIPALGFSSQSSISGSSIVSGIEYEEEGDGNEDYDEPANDSRVNTETKRRCGKTFGKKPSRDYAVFNEDGNLYHRRWECCGDYSGRHMRKCRMFNSIKHHTAGSWIPEHQKMLTRECNFCRRIVCVSCHYQRDLEFEYNCPDFPTMPTGIKNRVFACNWCHSAKGGNLDKNPILDGEVYEKNPWGPMNVGMRAQMKNSGLVPKCDLPKTGKRSTPDTPTPIHNGANAAPATRPRKRRRTIAI